MPEKLQHYGLYVYYVVHICDFGMLRVKPTKYEHQENLRMRGARSRAWFFFLHILKLLLLSLCLLVLHIWLVGFGNLVYQFTWNDKNPNVSTKLWKCIISVASFLVLGEGAKSPKSTNRTKINFHYNYMILITLIIAIMVIYDHYRYHYYLLSV